MAEEKTWRLLIINPGSTSTKVSLFDNEKCLFEHSLFHDAPELLKYPHVNGQLPFRYGVILDMLAEENIPPESIDVFVGRGGSAQTQPGGVTAIDEKLYEDTVAAVGAASTRPSWGSCWPGNLPRNTANAPIPWTPPTWTNSAIMPG